MDLSFASAVRSRPGPQNRLPLLRGNQSGFHKNLRGVPQSSEILAMIAPGTATRWPCARDKLFDGAAVLIDKSSWWRAGTYVDRIGNSVGITIAAGISDEVEHCRN